ncbi:MAG: hypothetical protein MJ099_02935, partial [Clostridia bacterium]|nr:hypothetical protein [Clostridia bacterium]
SVAAFREWGAVAVNPSVELTTGEIRPLQGERELIVHGRLPLMYLRHCPYRAVHGLKGKHAACRHCAGCAASERLEGRTLVDRTGTAFPLSRIASDDGCVIMLKNSVPLNLLKRFGKLPTADVYRILDDGDESIAQLVQVYRAAMNGQTVEWHEGATTTGHYFRGVE